LLINGEWRPAASGKTFDVEDPCRVSTVGVEVDAKVRHGLSAKEAVRAVYSSVSFVNSADRIRRGSGFP
jgi:succinate-semialdehyde dehydrogenase/glutarate-semialdehyde dehydrogenase